LDDFSIKNLIIEKDIYIYSNKAKELNFQYELNNNNEVDNGVLINAKSISYSSSSNISNGNSTYRNNFNENNIKYNLFDYINEQKMEKILNQIELMGYDREYVINSVKNNALNHASTIFFILMQYDNI